MPGDDPQIWAQARQRLPLPALMAKIGDGEFAKPSTKCPFCERRNKFGVFLSNGRHKFKCHHTSCVANEPEFGRSEIGYLALRKNLSVPAASSEYLQLAMPELAEERRAAFRAASERGEASSGPSPGDPLHGEPQNPWHALWQRLALNTADRAAIREKRGLSDETITRAGIRSNNQSNLHFLEALTETYQVGHLIAEGIYKSDERNVRPQGQLYGYGITDEKGPDGKRLFAQTNPPLIPYFDLKGIPYYMRPHKGGVTRPRDEHEEIETFETEDEGRRCASHPYCPPRLRELIEINDGMVLFVEGEWKALACEECDLPAIACPGITFIRNPAFKRELIKLFRELGVYDMVVIFDNEDKGDPAFPERFIANPWKRWETQVFAEIVSIELREFFEGVDGTCRIGMLPDEFRERGKADFDGILAKLVKEHGRDGGVRQARRVFRDSIGRATNRPELELFPTESRKIIEWRREQLFHRPLIPMGGDAETKLAQKFSLTDPTTGKPVDEELAAVYRGVRGCYYQRERGKTISQETFDKLSDEIERIKNATDAQAPRRLAAAYAHLAALWERRKGVPKAISDFTLKCEYRLVTTKGLVHRLVTVRNKMQKGATETRLYRLAPSDLSRLANFREWGYGMGKAVWKGGEVDTQNLVEDMDHHSFQRTIFEIDTYGYHPEYKMWFFGDCAFAENGACFYADERGIFWHQGAGYQLDGDKKARGSAFSQGTVLMLAPQDGAKPLADPPLGELFRRMCQEMFDAIGGYDGWLMVGAMLVYGIAPELVRMNGGGHPGLFLYGPKSGGKTTIMRWLCRIWGFKSLAGFPINQSSTHVGMNRALAQYSCLPLWFDEYRRTEIDEKKSAVIRNAFDRSAGLKGVATANNDTHLVVPMTTPTITGENSPADPATRSRYAHVMVSIERAVGDRHARMGRVQKDCQHYYLFGQYIMQNRPAFTKNCLDVLETWMIDEEVRKVVTDERARLVHGAAFAAFTVMTEMLDITDGPRTDEFRSFLIEHGRKALADVVEEGFLNTFWREVLSGLQTGNQAISQEFFALAYRRLDENGALKHCHADDTDAVHVLYLAPDALYAAYEKFLRSRGKEPPHGESDIRREAERQKYWVANPRLPNKERVHRLRIKGRNTTCWVINLERNSQADAGEEADSTSYLFPFADDFISALTKTGSGDTS